jgi:hypothetical protein
MITVKWGRGPVRSASRSRSATWTPDSSEPWTPPMIRARSSVRPGKKKASTGRPPALVARLARMCPGSSA